MSVYNGERFLRQAMDSILVQTFTDFEFIIVDDASSDETAQILSSYRDPRIIILRNDQNIGLAASLNRGIEASCGEYLARQDADDISFPTRLEKQLDYLNTWPEIGILGTCLEYINDDGHGQSREAYKPYSDHHLLAWACLFGPPFIHTSVLMRREVVAELGGYVGGPAQDYDLWSRALAITRFANLPEVLVRFRVHDQSVSKVYSTEQRRRAAEITRKLCSDLLGWDIGLQRAETLNILMRDERQATGTDAITVARLVRLLYVAYIRREGLNGQKAEDVRQDALMRNEYLFFTHRDRFPWASKLILWQIVRLDSLRGLGHRVLRRALRVFLGLRPK